MKRLALLALALAPIGAFAQVANGSFELPGPGSFQDWTVTPAPSGSFINVYTAVLGLTAEDGAYFAAFGATYGTSNFDAISQVVSTAPGGVYTLSFWIGASAQSSPTTNLFQAEWDGTMLYNAAAPEHEVGSTGVYTMTEETFQVTGTGSDTLLLQGNNGAAFTGLDNVTLTPSTPEPASIAMFGLGAVGLLRRRRGRRA